MPTCPIIPLPVYPSWPRWTESCSLTTRLAWSTSMPSLMGFWSFCPSKLNPCIYILEYAYVKLSTSTDKCYFSLIISHSIVVFFFKEILIVYTLTCVFPHLRTSPALNFTTLCIAILCTYYISWKKMSLMCLFLQAKCLHVSFKMEVIQIIFFVKNNL